MTRRLPSRARLFDIFCTTGDSSWQVVRRCALAALLLILTVYPDVIFRGASLSIVSFLNVTIEPAPKIVEILPERAGREAFHGHADAGGSAFQSEPSAQFVWRSLWSGESLYWNPHSATGTYGIETLVDVKTSPQTIFTALLGGGDLAFHVVLLALTYAGTLCLLLLFVIELRLSLLAAIAGGITFLLNGYNVPHPGANFSQTWIYFPVLAFALVSYARQPRVVAFLGIVAGALLILSTTFLPTTLMLLGVVSLAGAAAAIGFSYPDGSLRGLLLARAARVIAGQAGGILLAAMILAVVYLPIFEAMRIEATGEYYSQRIFYPATWFNFITLFTPKHAFEAYNAITLTANSLRGNIAYHQGIVGALLITQIFRPWPAFQKILLISAGTALVLLVARVYGLPGLTQAINILPVLGSIGQQYLWIGIAALVTLLVPFGVQGCLDGPIRRVPMLIGGAVILAALAYTTSVLGIETRYALIYIAIAVGLVASTLSMLLLGRKKLSIVVAAGLVVALSWAELTFYVNHHRVSRTDRFSNPPDFVRFLQLNAGLHRVASYGHYGVPPEYGSAYGLYDIGSMNFQLFPRYVDLFNRLVVPDPTDRWATFVTLVRAKDTDSINLGAFDLLGTKYLIVLKSYPKLLQFMTASPWRRAFESTYFVIFENPDPLPRVLVVRSAVVGAVTPLDLNRSPRDVVVTEDEHLLRFAKAQDGTPRTGAAASEWVAITRYDNDRVKIDAHLESPGILVLNDAWHRNWRATVDGQPLRIALVNQAFRGIELAAGSHVVDMSYAPRTLKAAKIISVVGLLLAIVVWLCRRRLNQWLTRDRRDFD